MVTAVVGQLAGPSAVKMNYFCGTVLIHTKHLSETEPALPRSMRAFLESGELLAARR